MHALTFQCLCIKQQFVANMSDGRVETLVHRICWYALDLDKLRAAIISTLTDDETDEDLVPEVWGDARQIAILRSIYSVLSNADVDIPRVRLIDQQTDRAERGPHFFNLVFIMYCAWSHRWREANGYADAPPMSVFCVESSNIC
jgi:hypothetical protein